MIIPEDQVDVQFGEYVLGKNNSVPIPKIALITDNYRQTVGQKQIPLMPDDLKAWKDGTNKWSIGDRLFASIKVDGEFRVAYYDRRRDDGERSFFSSHSTHKITAGLPVNFDLEELLNASPYEIVILAGELFASPSKPEDPPDFEIRSRPTDLIHALHSPEEPDMLDRVGFRVFDIIKLDHTNWLAKPFDERWQLIESLFPGSGRLAHAVGKILPARDLMDFFEEIVQQGQEGLVVRNPETFKAYKIKPVHSIDAVIVGAVDGFENSKILPGQLSSALVALRYPDGRYQLLTKVGSGLTEEERAALWQRLEFANQPNFVAATPDGRSYHMVRPTVVVEIDYFEIHTNRRDGTPTEQNALEYDANTNAWHVLRPLPFPKVRFPRFHDTHPIRDDKTGDIINVRVSQVLDLVSGSLVAPEFTPIDLPPSTMLARYVFTKGDSMVRKFLLWRTNKRAVQANFPDFIIYSLDYSLGRKNNPFQRRLLVTNDEEQAWSMLEENAATEMSGKGGLIMRGWDVRSFFDERQPDAPRPLLKFLGTGEVRPARAAKNARKKAAKKAAKKSAKSASARVTKPKPEIPSTFPKAKPGIKPRSPSISSVIKESESQPPLTASPPVLVHAVASRVPRVTEKAVCVENATGSTLWIPKIVIVPSDSAPTQVIDGPWSFAVKEWFAKKSEFNIWLAGQE